MPYVNLTDLIANCPVQLEANSIIVYDGCHWVLQQIPDGITCEDVLDCVDCEYLLSVLTFGSGLVTDAQTCTISVNPVVINQMIISTFDCNTGELTIGTTTLDLTCLLGMFMM